MNVFHIAGARPNFMEVAPVMNALKTRPHIVQTLVHTGQHYDANMSDVFLEQLGIPAPDVNLAVGSGSHARQTAEIMTRFEPALVDRKPDLVLVYGDVNSTVAAALVSAKLGVRVGHVEAGLRSFDRTMPEEINRLLTDQLSDLLFTPSEDADANLRNEGIPAEKIFRFGPRVFLGGCEQVNDFVRIDESTLAHADNFLLVFGQRFDWLQFVCGPEDKEVSIPVPAGLEMRTTMSRNSPVAGLGIRTRTTTCSNPRPSVAVPVCAPCRATRHAED